MRIAFLALPLLLACSPSKSPKTTANSDSSTDSSALATRGAAADGPSDITLAARDSMLLHATVSHPPEGPTGRLVVLAHQMCRDRTEWSEPAHDWVTALNAKGISTLAIDLRGHGPSTQFIDGSSHDLCKEIEDEAVQGLYSNMVMDVAGAVDYARQQLSATKVGVVGASIGANSALSAFGFDPEVAIAIALSPGTNYRNVQPAPAISLSKGREVVLIAAEDDKRSAAAVRELAALREGVASTIHKTGGHGNSILKANSGELDRLVTLLVDALK